MEKGIAMRLTSLHVSRLGHRWVFLLPLLFLLTTSFGHAQQEQQFLRFALLALTDDDQSRREFENQLVIRLQEDRFDAVASFELLPDPRGMAPGAVRRRLLDSGVQAVLILRPLELAEGTTLSPGQLQMSPGEFTSVSRFISGYRGDKFAVRTVVQIAGFLLQRDASQLFWHGVIWLDDTVETEQNRIDRIVDLVQFNLNNSRSALRAQLGFPALRPD